MNSSQEIIFIITDLNYNVISEDMNNFKTVITIFGKTQSNNEIQIKIEDFLPYFYIQLTRDVNINTLEEYLKLHLGSEGFVGLEKHSRMPIYGYHEEEQIFYKVFFKTPSEFKNARAFFGQSIYMNNQQIRVKLFESNFPLILKFLTDMEIVGMGYASVKSYVVEQNKPLIISTSYKLIESLGFKGEYQKIPSFNILSFDIECCSPSPSSFPTPSSDPIIQIGNTMQSTAEPSKYRKTIFCLKETGKIVDVDVRWYESEKELLQGWKDFVLEEDPDILLGYNIKNFDLMYISERAKALKMYNFFKLGRTEKVSKIYKRTKTSKAVGSIEGYEVEIEGRLIFDLYQIIKRDYKLRNYTLNAVSLHFLNMQKEDVPHYMIYKLQNEDKFSRQRIASYCIKDTELPLILFEKLKILINYCELSRVTGVPIEYFTTRGSAIKVLSQIYREARKSGYVIPDMENIANEDSFEGGFVMEPKRGYYQTPVAVLDFSSLYPSILIGSNLCYSTLLRPDQVEKHKEYSIQTPSGNYFVQRTKKVGLLPVILKNLLDERAKTKKMMKDTKDAFLQKVLDGRQLALKICANSIYGFTGATFGQLPCIEISQSTTAIGRKMIAFTKSLIESNFTTEKGFQYDTEVIYGDTDSVMINFNEKNLKKVFSMAKEIAGFVTNKFHEETRKNDDQAVCIINLEFEKVFYPYILMNKKRYAGLIYTNPSKPDRIDTKGIETIRRDNCLLLKNLVESCLHKILYENDVEGAANIVKKTVKDLYNDRVDLFDLIISKTYTKAEYKAKSAHVELVKKLKRRGIDVKIGDRISYVVVEGGNKNTKVYDKAEDPLYVLEKGLPIDVRYYIEQQLSNPIKRLFEPILSNVDSLFADKNVTEVKRQTSSTGPLCSLFTKKDQCIGCGISGSILCKNCQKDFTRHLMELQQRYEDKILEFNKCWTECQRCVKSLMTEITCNNDGCPIFYRRVKVKKELIEIQKKINQVNSFEW